MKYEIVIIDAIGGKSAKLRATLEKRVAELNLDPATTLEFHDHRHLNKLVPGSPKLGVLFSSGPKGTKFGPEVERLLGSPAVVIPVVDSLLNFTSKVPKALYPTNGMALDPKDPDLERVAALMLELLRLVRKRRRVFISYMRAESSGVAQQLHQELEKRSFDVFLDTLSVRAADPFQEQLWHRMCDSDVVVLLWTPGVRDQKSSWVQQEIDRACAMKITVLQLIWPKVERDGKTDLFEPLYLTKGDLVGRKTVTLNPDKAAEICTLVESLRARSLAGREAALVGTVRDLAKARNVTTTIQPTRCVDVHRGKGFARLIPAIGVPDSESFQSGATAPVDGKKPSSVVLLYDCLSIDPNWVKHLDWLHTYLPVKTLKTSEVEHWLKRNLA